MTEPTTDELVVSKVKDALSDMQGMVSEAGFASCVRDLQEFVPRLLALVAAQAEQIDRVRALCRESEIATASAPGDGSYRARVLVADTRAALDGTEDPA